MVDTDLTGIHEGGAMAFICRIFVEETEIYSGGFAEIPERFRQPLRDDLLSWADQLGKGGLNELLYSHLAWYIEHDSRCAGCGFLSKGYDDTCPVCGSALEKTYEHERNERLDRILTCVGTITSVQVSA